MTNALIRPLRSALFLFTVLSTSVFAQTSPPLPTGAPAVPQIASACATPQAFTGTWQGNDGSLYTLRQVGGQIWGIGKSKDAGFTWTSVLQGVQRGQTVRFIWTDVSGTRRSTGTLTVQSNMPNDLTVFKRVAGTGATTADQWLYSCNDTFSAPPVP